MSTKQRTRERFTGLYQIERMSRDKNVVSPIEISFSEGAFFIEYEQLVDVEGPPSLAHITVSKSGVFPPELPQILADLVEMHGPGNVQGFHIDQHGFLVMTRRRA